MFITALWVRLEVDLGSMSRASVVGLHDKTSPARQHQWPRAQIYSLSNNTNEEAEDVLPAQVIGPDHERSGEEIHSAYQSGPSP